MTTKKRLYKEIQSLERDRQILDDEVAMKKLQLDSKLKNLRKQI